MRMCVLRLQPPSGQWKLSTIPAEPPVAVAPRLSHQGSAWRANEEGRVRSHRGEGRSRRIIDAPFTGKYLIFPEVTVPRSVHRKTDNENKITCANMQMKQNQRKTPPHYRRSDQGNSRPPVASRPAKTADSRAARETRARKDLLGLLSLPGSVDPFTKLPSERRGQEKRLCKRASAG